LQAEIDRATAAETTLTTNLNAEVTRATGIEATLQANIDSEIARATAKEDDLQSQIDGFSSGILPPGYSMRFGVVSSNGAGIFNVNFSPPFATSCDSVVTSTQSEWWAGVDTVSASGFTGKTASPLATGWVGGPVGVNWIAIGH
jgi:hypothetical protein